MCKHHNIKYTNRLDKRINLGRQLTTGYIWFTPSNIYIYIYLVAAFAELAAWLRDFCRNRETSRMCARAYIVRGWRRWGARSDLAQWTTRSNYNETGMRRTAGWLWLNGYNRATNRDREDDNAAGETCRAAEKSLSQYAFIDVVCCWRFGFCPCV